MIARELARRLRDAGLGWVPREGDRFFIPDSDLDDEVFSISEMTVDVQPAPGGQLIAFNGTVEWALDSVLEHEVVWLPSEAQLRERLGDRFVALHRERDGFRCVIEAPGGPQSFTAPEAADSYGRALLDCLERDGALEPLRP